jgi:hypothetical protein
MSIWLFVAVVVVVVVVEDNTDFFLLQRLQLSNSLFSLPSMTIPPTKTLDPKDVCVYQ